MQENKNIAQNTQSNKPSAPKMPGKVRFFFKRAQMLHCLTQAFKGSNFEIVFQKNLSRIKN
jgi:hypothetical protein